MAEHGRTNAAYRTAAIGALTAAVVIGTAPLYIDTYMTSILVRAFFLAALTMTVDVLWGYTGILTFGQSAFFGIGAYACALVFTHYGFGAGWAVLALALGIVVAMATAALIGWLAFYHGASPLYASIITLALPIVLVQLIFAGGTVHRLVERAFRLPDLLLELRNVVLDRRRLSVVVTAVGWLFVRSDFGRVLVAIRENEERCAYLGVPVSRDEDRADGRGRRDRRGGRLRLRRLRQRRGARAGRLPAGHRAADLDGARRPGHADRPGARRGRHRRDLLVPVGIAALPLEAAGRRGLRRGDRAPAAGSGAGGGRGRAPGGRAGAQARRLRRGDAAGAGPAPAGQGPMRARRRSGPRA